MVRKYKGSREEYEQKLGRVMGRLGVQVYDYDWSRRGCWVQMVYAGRAYRFENSVDKSAESGRLSNLGLLYEVKRSMMHAPPLLTPEHM